MPCGWGSKEVNESWRDVVEVSMTYYVVGGVVYTTRADALAALAT